MEIERMVRGRTGPNFTKEKRWAVLADYKAGLKMKKIQQKHDVCYQYASSMAKRYGLPMRSKARTKAAPSLKTGMLDDYFKGLNGKALARKYNIGNSYIWAVLKAAGITPNRQKRTRWEKVR